MSYFERSLSVPVSRRELFAWHQRPGAFERLAPSWERIEIVERSGSIEDGDRLHFRVRKGPISLSWVARHEGFVAGQEFVDVAERSPFASWRHVHTFEDDGQGSRLRDAVTYRLPLDRLTDPLVGARVEAMLERMFRQRHVRTANDLRRHQAAAARGRGPMRVAIAGASGLVGVELQAFLSTGGHAVVPVVRRGPELEGLDAVVDLAGESIEQTKLRCEALARLEHKPRVLVCAAAIGISPWNAKRARTEAEGRVRAVSTGVGTIYGDGGERLQSEATREWEAATRPAIAAGVRVVQLRIGLVNSGHAGALAQLRMPFSLGLGGRIGDGQQWHSWIDLDDLVAVIHHAILCDELRGPVNAVAPAPVRQLEYAQTLGRVLDRPARLRLPAALADELLRASVRVSCQRLLDSGFSFDFPTLEHSLRHQLGRLEA